jgi:hypothetical protein
MRRMRRCVGVASVVAWGASASAQTAGSGDVTAAAAAFQQAQQAQLVRDFARAADLFELADRAAPSAAALRSAIRTHQAAGHIARAATLALYAGQRDTSDPLSVQLSRAVRAELSPRLVLVRVRCSIACGIAVDGRADVGDRRSEHGFYVDPGIHELTVSFEGRATVRQSLEGAAGAEIERAVSAPAPEPSGAATNASDPAVSSDASEARSGASRTSGVETRASSEAAIVEGRTPAPRMAAPEPAARTGLRPVYFAVAAGASVVLGGVLVWSGWDTLRARDVYVADPTEARFLEGRGLETRTNALIGATVLVGAATAAVGVFTQWRAPEVMGRPRVGAWVGGDHAEAVVSGIF